jgi:hypothetical protein
LSSRNAPSMSTPPGNRIDLSALLVQNSMHYA